MIVFARDIEVVDGVAVEVAIDGDFGAWIDLEIEGEAVLAGVGTGLQANFHDTFADRGLVGERGDMADNVGHRVMRA